MSRTKYDTASKDSQIAEIQRVKKTSLRANTPECLTIATKFAHPYSNGILFAMKPKLSIVQTQKQILAPVLQQSISILMLSLGELNSSIEQELQNNPMLEVQPEKPMNKALDLPIFQLKRASEAPTQQNYDQEDSAEVQIVHQKSLEEHLMTQLRIEIIDPVKQKIGELIIGNLDTDGYLTTSLEEISVLSTVPDINLIEQILKKIQMFDPIGIASRSIKECLLNQIRASGSIHTSNASHIIDEYFTEFFQKKFESLAKKLNISHATIMEIAQFIATLEPKPARNYQHNDQTVYVQPDVFLTQDSDGNFQIEVNRGPLPVLRINPQYMNLLKNPGLTAHEKKFLQERLTQALNFIKSIQQRGDTVLKISQYIVERQKSFFEGNINMLSPMSLKDIAQALERNESTISRAINNKYMETPLGLFPLRHFFTHAVNENNKETSSHTIKEEIKTLIENEDKNNPLSDQDIIQHFQSRGIKMARRTVNKYRLELDIPSSHKRKM